MESDRETVPSNVDPDHIKILYLVSIIIWLIGVSSSGLWTRNVVMPIILSYPLVEFMVFIFYPPVAHKTMSSLLVNTGAYTLFFLIKNTTDKKYGSKNPLSKKLSLAFVASMILFILASSNVWDSRGVDNIMIFVPSVLVTMGMSLIAYAIIGGYIIS